MCRIAPVHGNRCVDIVIQFLGEMGTMPGLKVDERGLLFIEIKIRVFLKVFLTLFWQIPGTIDAIMPLFSVHDI